MLKKYVSNPSHILEAPPFELNEDLSFEVQLVGILDQGIKELRNKSILMVKVCGGMTSLKKQLGKLRHS